MNTIHADDGASDMKLLIIMQHIFVYFVYINLLPHVGEEISNKRK